MNVSAVRDFTRTFLAQDLPSLVVLGALVAVPETRGFALTNAGVQLALIIGVACVPAYRTRLMAWVDVAWPWGLVAIGVQTAFFGDLGSATVQATAVIYLVTGGRMAAWGTRLMLTSRPVADLPRYRYQRIRWERHGYRGQDLPMQHEILQQGLGNASVLALPAVLVASVDRPTNALVLVAGITLWAGGWILESVADLQKARFISASTTRRSSRTCEVGLWAYSRHPNYFFQWVQWHGPVLIALPAVLELREGTDVLLWVSLLLGLFGLSAMMAYVLNYWTGAVPAEHYSVLHRPEYRDYQRRVNRFVSGPRRRT